LNEGPFVEPLDINGTQITTKTLLFPVEMSFRLAVVLLFVAVAAAFKRTPMQMNIGNKIAASLAGAMMILPTSAFAGNLDVQSSPVAIEKKARFYIGGGIHKDESVVNEKKARFYIGGGIHKNALLTALAMDLQSPVVVEKKARFYIGGGIHKDAPIVNEKKARFYIGGGIHKDDASLLEKKARFYIGAGIH
jgi:hypothetical protein